MTVGDLGTRLAPPPNEGEALGTRLRSEGEVVVTVLAWHYSLPSLPKLEVRRKNGVTNINKRII